MLRSGSRQCIKGCSGFSSDQILDKYSNISAAEESKARREGAEVLKEMSRSPTVQKSRTGDSAPEEEMPEPPPDENGHTSDSLPKGAGKSAGHWQPS